MLRVGQGVLGRIKFLDGQIPPYDRTYLVVSVNITQTGFLNVSSIAGKEHKLLYPSNKRITQYNPPFLKESFVKLDSLVFIPNEDTHSLQILHNGDCLQPNELNIILQLINISKEPILK